MSVIITDTPRRKSDFYPTPYGLCDYTVSTIIPHNFIPATVLDPGAGEGRWGIFIRKRWPKVRLDGLDIEDYTNEKDKLTGIYNSYYNKMNYFNFISYEPYDLIIGNPPFSLAEEFIRLSLKMGHKDSYILFLLKTDFLAGIKRMKGLWREYPPKEVWICSKRPGFNTPQNRRTDSNTYAIYLWQRSWFDEPIIKWLDWDYDKDLDYG